MTRALVSAVVTHLGVMRAHWAKNAALSGSGQIGTDKPIGRDVDLGGCVASIDLTAGHVEWTKNIDCPAGMAFTQAGLFVASMRRNSIQIYDATMTQTGQVDHAWINDPHGIDIPASEETVLVASSGVDSILELNRSGNLVWNWTAYDHGLDRDQFGDPVVRNFGEDLRGTDFPTLRQATHVNSVLGCQASVFAVLFHQGVVIKIDRESGRWQPVVSGLRHPHGLRRTDDGYSICDTRSGRVLFMDNGFRFTRIIPVDSDWVADALPLSNESVAVADGSASRILIIDANDVVADVIELPSEWKLFSLELIPPSWDSLGSVRQAGADVDVTH